METEVKAHYHSGGLIQRIKTALSRAGKDLSALTTRDLGAIDQLHTGGAKATAGLARKLDLAPDRVLLDAGCGLGGAARLLAETSGCRVTGIDLAEEFIHAARFLTDRTGLAPNVSFKQGSILDLPFEAGTFDAVLCQHVLMNIEDKDRAFTEINRVLKSGGLFVLHEITRGPGDRIQLPVPWAADPAISFLLPWPDMALRLKAAEFTRVHSEDRSEFGRQWWTKVSNAVNRQPFSTDTLGPGLVLGKNAAFFGPNMKANFDNNAIHLIEAVLKKTES